MKKIFLSLVFAMVSIASFGQSVKEKNEFDVTHSLDTTIVNIQQVMLSNVTLLQTEDTKILVNFTYFDTGSNMITIQIKSDKIKGNGIFYTCAKDVIFRIANETVAVYSKYNKQIFMLLRSKDSGKYTLSINDVTQFSAF